MLNKLYWCVKNVDMSTVKMWIIEPKYVCKKEQLLKNKLGPHTDGITSFNKIYGTKHDGNSN